MSGRRWLSYLAVLGAAATLACGDFSSPTSPLQKPKAPIAPVNAAYGRYILISGVWTCVDGCDDDAGGGTSAKVDGDSASTAGLPVLMLSVDSATSDQ
jgi:hypothetical protein